MKKKYPKSWHLPYSEKGTDDDKKHSDDSHLVGKHVIVTLKKDGENTSIYNDYIHARSIDSDLDDESRRYMDTLRVAKVQGNIPPTYRICGENMFYKHTIHYTDLETYFFVFSMWDGDRCLSYKDTLEYCEFLGLTHVPVIYEGIYDRDLILKLYKDKYTHEEGFVVRNVEEFIYDDFKYNLNKFVSSKFIISETHWRYIVKTPNNLKDGLNPYNLL